MRNCQEELDITLTVKEPFMDVTHEYPHAIVHLTLLNATILEGTPTLLEHFDMAWIEVGEISNYMFCQADEVFLKELVGRKKNAP